MPVKIVNEEADRRIPHRGLLRETFRAHGEEGDGRSFHGIDTDLNAMPLQEIIEMVQS